MVLVDGGQFVFFSQDSDSFSGKGANRLFSLCYLHIDLQLLRDDGGGDVSLLGDDVLLELVPNGLGPEDGVIKLVLGLGLGPGLGLWSLVLPLSFFLSVCLSQPLLRAPIPPH